ncbi:MAG: Ig-like domain-containing protein [Clostridia bacterium]|nr:Ig-like domain-containing protein [Clostridia bacterium]
MLGVTISAITGSESTPAKANEAGQKNDIGTAKDDISLTVVNAKMQGMETAYVENGVSAEDASTTVGTEVIKAVAQKYQTNNKIGKATIEIEGFGTLQNVTSNAIISIYTTDFEITGIIYKEDGNLTFGEIEICKPKIRITNVPSVLAKGSKETLTIQKRNISEEAQITWTSDKTNIISVSNNGEIEGKKIGTAKITASVEENNTTYTAQCTIKVEAGKADIINEQIGTEISYPKAIAETETTEGVPGYSANYIGTWKIFYANSEEMFIIPSSMVQASAVGFNTAGIPISYESEANGSKSVATLKPTGSSEKERGYGYKYNKLWLQQCGQIESNGNVSADVKQNDNRHKATAYLCNPNNWTSFVLKYTNGTQIIENSYAVGGPTAELFIEAWNEAKKDTKDKNVVSAGYETNSMSTAAVTIQTTDGKGVFRPTTSGYYWLASPFGRNNQINGVLWIDCINGCMSATEYNSWYAKYICGIRPLVSIPMSNINIDDETGAISILDDNGKPLND